MIIDMTTSHSRPLLVGVTGNIGSGKTLFCKYLEEMGARVISADPIAQSILDTDAVINVLVKKWGNQILKNGVPNREKIAAIVFNDTHELEFLNGLIHPLVLKEFDDLIQSADEKQLIFEIPLLFEAGLENCLDFIVLITAGENIRIDRLVKRDKADKQTILKRMSKQLPEEAKIPRSDLVIKNEGDTKLLKEEANQLIMGLSAISRKLTVPFSQL